MEARVLSARMDRSCRGIQPRCQGDASSAFQPQPFRSPLYTEPFQLRSQTLQNRHKPPTPRSIHVPVPLLCVIEGLFYTMFGVAGHTATDN